MNEMNLPETQLSSWRPRHPSAALKRRIFQHSNNTSSTLAARWLWGALTPTAACLLLTLLMLNSGNSVIRQKPEMTTILSNQGDAFCDSDGGQTAENHVASVTFDWTNHSVFNSSKGFTPTTNLSN
ncbi:MAG: hypothetical protein ABSE48_10260 [Verrucomicrobiota bacterium]